MPHSMVSFNCIKPLTVGVEFIVTITPQNEQLFSPKRVREIFEVSTQTVTNWTNKFKKYLSAHANVKTYARKSYTLRDLEIFALIQAYTHEGKSYDEIEPALASGMRGVLPISPEAFKDAPPQAIIASFQQKIELLELEKTDLIEQFKTEKNQLIGAKNQLEETYSKQLKEREEKIDELKETIFELKAQLKAKK